MNPLKTQLRPQQIKWSTQMGGLFSNSCVFCNSQNVNKQRELCVFADRVWTDHLRKQCNAEGKQQIPCRNIHNVLQFTHTCPSESRKWSSAARSERCISRRVPICALPACIINNIALWPLFRVGVACVGGRRHQWVGTCQRHRSVRPVKAKIKTSTNFFVLAHKCKHMAPGE